MTTGPDITDGGGEAGRHSRSSAERRAALAAHFEHRTGQTAVPDDYIAEAVDRVVAWLDAPMTNDVELLERTEDAYELVAELEAHYPGDGVWDDVRVMLATDLFMHAELRGAAGILAMSPTVERTVNALVSMVAGLAQRGRADMQHHIGILFVRVHEALYDIDPAAADEFSVILGIMPPGNPELN